MPYIFICTLIGNSDFLTMAKAIVCGSDIIGYVSEDVKVV